MMGVARLFNVRMARTTSPHTTCEKFSAQAGRNSHTCVDHFFAGPRVLLGPPTPLPLFASPHYAVTCDFSVARVPDSLRDPQQTNRKGSRNRVNWKAVTPEHLDAYAAAADRNSTASVPQSAVFTGWSTSSKRPPGRRCR